MAVPKRRKSASKQGMRRSQHDKVSPPNLVPCPNCSAPSRSHRVCASCGQYKGRVIFQSADQKAS
ncbi:MAG: 50S ribosomal protein L32 [Polyangiaceae bacterium]|nr:50S ribosomal protein L32 [Polyangiaceae bacterium]